MRKGRKDAANEERGRRRALTEVPLPSAEHLEQRGDERADAKVPPMRGDIYHPNKPDEDIGHLSNRRRAVHPSAPARVNAANALTIAK